MSTKMDTRINIYTSDTVDDDEIQLLLSTDNDTSSVSIDECEQATTRLTIPKLPNSLEYHLYVVSASEDRLVVNELVTKLESKYAIKCMFSDRDFQPGKEILQNVKDGMEKSMKILLIYTPNFGRSEFCKLETNIALQSAMDSGIYCIIPVMLQECEVTFSMRHKTYINGTLPGMTISKIADYIKEAMTRTEATTEQISASISRRSDKYKNGVSVPIPATIKSCTCGSAAFEFKLENEYLQLLKAKNIKVSEKMLQHAISMLNSDLLINSDVISTPLWIGCKLACCPCAFFFCLCCAIYLLLLISMASPIPQETIVTVASNGGMVLLAPLVLTIFVIAWLGYCCGYRKKKVCRAVREKLWNEISLKTYKDNVVFSLAPSNMNPPSLRIIRYDVTECKQYMVALFRSQHEEEGKSDQYFEEKAELAIQAVLRVMCAAGGVEAFPDADNRHNVIQDKMCLCRFYEYNYLMR